MNSSDRYPIVAAGMAREPIKIFIEHAQSRLASIRSSLLIVAQTGDISDLGSLRRELFGLNEASIELDLSAISNLIARAIVEIDHLAGSPGMATANAYAALDLVAQIDAAVWTIPRESDEFPDDLSGFIDASFSEFIPPPPEDNWADADFEIDDETLDIFRTEADELLARIVHDLAVLADSPSDQKALWEIRRNAHTFKGAAGIVGLSEASTLAHRMEDLLDKAVELRVEATPELTTFLSESAKNLEAIVAARKIENTSEMDHLFRSALVSVQSSSAIVNRAEADPSKQPITAIGKSDVNAGRPASPIVRVSLDRLDDLLKVSRSLLAGRSELDNQLAHLQTSGEPDKEALDKLEAILNAHHDLTDALHAKLLRIRMVRFGTLETRLNRAVNVTSQDEGKRTKVEIENADVEIDTQIIDSLIEPLLHLLKNAVVHGIELPETRRLIGKPEIGTVSIRIDADDEAVVLAVSDDGGGISVSKLKEKAVANGIIDRKSADSLDDREAIKLIFDRGLTTSENVNLNAGRGIGMSIVKESVENNGGTVVVESEPYRGTTFTILMPLAVARTNDSPARSENQPDAERSTTPLVLVVDDSASIRLRTTKILENAGLRVITANNGADALELLLNGTFEPELILSDVEMPQIDGWELLEYVKTDENLGHIPIVMVTSLDADEHRTRAEQIGASDYIIKPFGDADLSRILEKIGLTAAA